MSTAMATLKMLTELSSFASIPVATRIYEEKGNIELSSFIGIQAQACRGGEEGTPVAHQLPRNGIDETLGTTAP
jgi:hypothetical protein